MILFNFIDESVDFGRPLNIPNAVNHTQQENQIHSSKNNTKSYEKLPDHCSQTVGPREVVIKGERHTGTNLLHKIINTNICHEEVKMNSPDIGWKHGFLPPDGWGRPMSENEVLVVQTRDVFTWLPLMFHITYDPIMDSKRRFGFSSFIRSQYACSLQPRPEVTFGQHVREHTLQEKFRLEHKHHFAETADNIVKIREKKYKQWLSDDPSADTFKGSKEVFLKNRIHVRLESIIDDHCDGKNCTKNGRDVKLSQYQHIARKLLDRCISVPFYEDFQEITKYTKFDDPNSTKHIYFNVQKEREETLQMYEKDDLRFVLSQLDLEFEKQIGYDYSYINDILKE